MGMTMALRRCDGDTIARLRAQPDTAGAFVAPEDGQSVPEGELIDLQKEWHAIHFLLVGAPWDADVPVGALLAGEEMGEDLGYDPPRLLTPDKVRAFDAVLSAKPDDFVETTFDFAAVEAAEIYPPIWDRRDPRDIDYIASNFRILKTFVRETAAAGNGIVMVLL